MSGGGPAQLGDHVINELKGREREERERLLSRYKGADRELIEDAVRDHPGLTVAKAIEMLDAFGGL